MRSASPELRRAPPAPSAAPPAISHAALSRAPVRRLLRAAATLALGGLLALSAPLGADRAQADEFEAPLRALAEGRLSTLAADPVLVAAVKTQNEAAEPSPAEIERLDTDWRGQVGGGVAPLVDTVMARPASKRLAEMVEEGEGLITEVIVMDRVGLNVAISEPTSDYWQGDEAKWSETYLVGPGAVHVSEVELDESTQTYQAQVSLTVSDPEGGAAIGAITFGINVEFLE